MPFTLPTENADMDFVSLLTYLSGQLPFLFPIILFFIFISIVIAGYFAQERRTGRGNLAQWLSIGSFVTTTGALILFLIPNVIDLVTISTCVALTLLFGIWFMFSEKD